MNVSITQPSKATFAPNVTNKTLQNVKSALEKRFSAFYRKTSFDVFMLSRAYIQGSNEDCVVQMFWKWKKKDGKPQTLHSAQLIMCEKQNPNVDSLYKCFAVFSFVHIKAKPLETFHNFQLLSHWNAGSNDCRCEKYTNI